MRQSIEKVVQALDLPMKDFTLVLKNFYKENKTYSGRWVRDMSYDDAKYLYEKSSEVILTESTNDIAKYNALRFIKIGLSEEKNFREVFEKSMVILFYVLLHNNGILRNEAIHFLSAISFEVICASDSWTKKNTKKQIENKEYYYPILIDFYFALQSIDHKYEEANKENLEYSDLTKKEFMPYS